MTSKNTSITTDKSQPKAVVGVLMLETQFPRLIGDIGNAGSWPFPVRYRIVKNASAKHAVQQNPRELLPAFIEEANLLVDEGVAAITTSCGFLSVFQQELLAAIGVPVVTSALMQVPWINTILPKSIRCGVLTIDAKSLSGEHLTAVGAPVDTPIMGIDATGNFATTIFEDRLSFDIEACRAENVAGALQLVEQHKGIGAIVLECTNMVPYKYDIQLATGLPVYSIHSLVCWMYNGMNRNL